MLNCVHKTRSRKIPKACDTDPWTAEDAQVSDEQHGLTLCEEEVPHADETARIRAGQSYGLGLVSSSWTHENDSNTYFWPSVNHVDEVTSGISFPNSLQHLLIFQAPGTEARQRLAAPADGGLRVVIKAAPLHQVDSHQEPPDAFPQWRTPEFTDAPC